MRERSQPVGGVVDDDDGRAPFRESSDERGVRLHFVCRKSPRELVDQENSGLDGRHLRQSEQPSLSAAQHGGRCVDSIADRWMQCGRA